MKRGGPLRRKTPLRARKVTEPPADDAEPATAQRGLDPTIFAAVVKRDQDCQGKQLIGGACKGRLDCHHVWRKGQGGPDHEDNLVLLCRAHHDWVHAHVVPSLALGFLSSSWDGMAGARAAAERRRASWP